MARGVPLDPIWYHAIEVAATLGCAQDMVDIVVLCNKSSIFEHQPRYKQAGGISNLGSAYGPSDHIQLANAFNSYLKARENHMDGKEPRDLDAWCRVRFLDHSALEEVRLARRELGPCLNMAKVEALRSPANETTVSKALAIAFCTQTAIYHGGADEYRTVHGNVTARLDPHSSLVDRSSEWVVFSDLSLTGSNAFLSTCTVVNPEWLMVRFLCY